MGRLTSFHYTAIFPFYNHVDDILKLVRNKMQLECFSVKLAPDPESKIIEVEQSQGRIDLADAWMELETAYEIIAHNVLSLGYTSSLVRFQSLDFGIEGIRSSLEKKLNDHLSTSWTYLDNGTWSKESHPKTENSGGLVLSTG